MALLQEEIGWIARVANATNHELAQGRAAQLLLDLSNPNYTQAVVASVVRLQNGTLADLAQALDNATFVDSVNPGSRMRGRWMYCCGARTRHAWALQHVARTDMAASVLKCGMASPTTSAMYIMIIICYVHNAGIVTAL